MINLFCLDLLRYISVMLIIWKIDGKLKTNVDNYKVSSGGNAMTPNWTLHLILAAATTLGNMLLPGTIVLSIRQGFSRNVHTFYW